MAPTSRIVVFANRFGHPWLSRNCPHAALTDLNVAAVVARLQFAVQAEFHAQTLAAHASLRLGASDLVAMARERERVVVTDHTLFHVTQNGSQIQLRRQCPIFFVAKRGVYGN